MFQQHKGRITPDGPNWQFEYTLSGLPIGIGIDNLPCQQAGARVSFTDSDGDGTIDKMRMWDFLQVKTDLQVLEAM